MTQWPTTVDALVAAQHELAAADPEPWRPPAEPLIGGCFAAFPKGYAGPGAVGDPVWAGAAAYRRRRVCHATTSSAAGWSYRPGLLALRVGPVLDAVVRLMPQPPDVLLVDATGRDHPRRCGLAVQLGAMLDLPTVGVTHRLLLAGGEWPPDERGATSPVALAGDVVAYWLRTRQGRRPVAVHAGWRTDPDVAVRVVSACAKHRTPTPLREARRLARAARAGVL
ncbi:endonuclease V [Haloechinothrix halophila]|uniref:endonuclease V n=1 Tax=Haloechinothrix halophila TaxID=1069073 RepID=UPI00041FD5AD|nr:endonuclease V [Haloechinothrix halophila]